VRRSPGAEGEGVTEADAACGRGGSGGGFCFAPWSRAADVMEEGSGEVADRRRDRGGTARCERRRPGRGAGGGRRWDGVRRFFLVETAQGKKRQATNHRAYSGGKNGKRKN
jgi:hypothetical protein